MGERLLLIASGLWVGGVAAWAPIAGFLLAPRFQTRGGLLCADELQGGGIPTPSEGDEQPGASALDVSSVTPGTQGPPKRKLRSRSNRAGEERPGKLKLRSRRAGIAEPVEEKFIPLVPGARGGTAESIVAAYAGETLAAKQEAGEDFWIDPDEVQKDVARTRASQARTKLFKRREKVYSPDKLKSEISAPYRNNAIGYVVLAVAVVVTGLSFFPELLELNRAAPTFPDAL